MTAAAGSARSILGALVAVALATGGILLESRGTAELLMGADSPLLTSVAAGIWIFKLWLVVHAAVIFAATRMRPGGTGAVLLTGTVAPEDRLRHAGWMLAGLLAAGAALRLYALGEGLWYDEITAFVNYARAPLPRLLTIFDSQNNHLLYSLLAQGAIGLFGESPWALRLPAALFGVASLWAVWWLGSLIASQREGLLAAGLLAASYHHVWFSQNARGYTGLLFFALLSTALLVRLLRGDRVHGWAPVVQYAAASALGIYTHPSAVFVTGAHFLVWSVLAIRARTRGERLGWPGWMPMLGIGLTGTLTLQLYGPVLPQVVSTMSAAALSGTATEWKQPAWFVTEAVRMLARGIPGGLVTVGAALAIGAAGAVSYARRSPALLALMLLPAVLIAGAMLAADHNLWPRLFFFCAGFAALVAVRGVMTLATIAVGSRGTLAATIVLLLGTAASLTTVPRAWAPKQDFTGAHAFVEARRGPADAVVTLDLTRFPYEDYLRTGWTAASDRAELASIEARHARTWVLYTFPVRLRDMHPELWEHLHRNYTREMRFRGTVGGGTIVVMVRE